MGAQGDGLRDRWCFFVSRKRACGYFVKEFSKHWINIRKYSLSAELVKQKTGRNSSVNVKNTQTNPVNYGYISYFTNIPFVVNIWVRVWCEYTVVYGIWVCREKKNVFRKRVKRIRSFDDNESGSASPIPVKISGNMRRTSKGDACREVRRSIAPA